MVNGLLAQLVEQVTLNHRVVGSIPTQPTLFHISDKTPQLNSEVRFPKLSQQSKIILENIPHLILQLQTQIALEPQNLLSLSTVEPPPEV